MSQIKRTLPYYFFAIILLGLGCKNNKAEPTNNIDPFESAVPHGAEVPSLELSDEDKNRLALAKGKTAGAITASDLDSMFKYSTEQLYLYSFWKSNDSLCLTMNQNLLRLKKEYEEEALKLVFISLDDSTHFHQMNSFIRENSVTSDVFFTSEKINTEWFSQVHPSWTGKVPAIYLKNNSDGTNLFYSKLFTFEELSALIQPFVL